MPINVAKLVAEWDNALKTTSTGERYDLVYERLSFFSRHIFQQYLPTMSAEHPDFEKRLAEWLGMLPDDCPGSRRILFELASRLYFFSREDFDKLHHAALHGPIAKWLVDVAGLQFSAVDFNTSLNHVLQNETWFCGLSDSMPIADFHHVNNLGGINFRPDMRTLGVFSTAQQITKFMADHHNAAGACPLRRIVVLEDFIGSGSQFTETIPLIGDLCGRGVQILLVPLMICPGGDALIRGLVAGVGANLRYEPVLILSEKEFIHPQRTANEPPLHSKIRRVVRATYGAVVGDNASAPRPYHPFGFPPDIPGQRGGTGSLVVMFSNTPANTLPLIQHKSNKWKPLFPRSARVR